MVKLFYILYLYVALNANEIQLVFNPWGELP